ncbi:putative TOS1-like glycosyl hydrolase-domain-containing protein [Fomitopsis serialis]|uniref:putative TOS1-like glycosyl hydrolase-domain-containing protein n=1 Tax=Fomitopsis serialis TaxID=139415 RepID=UPI002008B1C9|nr:putative TOS1-like glycosyl hydrolase-domain-containing protein [Neoantrodia serialis]KAH9927753.1 putative TOS1-like glycosyl hydrolase-domain-containing protein [Neoantrodia serialis]
MRRDNSLTSIKYTGIGGSGSYNKVTDLVPGDWPSCSVSNYCQTESVSVSGNLAPFDDEMTIAFRGPMTISNIAVYQPANTSAATWSQVSSWTAGGSANNLVFMNNKGGGLSGEWSVCGGASQSYANGNWTDAAASPMDSVMDGTLPAGQEVNIVTATACSDTNACSAFTRGTSNHGWGESKMFVMTVTMPDSSDASQVPAVWALNAQVVWAAQYGCNCRGEGVGGCGELDIAEVLYGNGDDPSAAISEIYSFKGATGSGASAFARPVDTPATFGIVFDVDSDAISVQELTEWDYTQTAIPRSIVNGYLDASAGETVSFSANARRADKRSIFGAHHRRRNH